MRRAGRRAIGRWVVVVVVASVATASCAAENRRSDQQGGSRPSGEPVVVGFINVEGVPDISIPEIRAGSEAAVAYLNAESGGLGGRPIELEVCITTGAPESSAACAHKMVAQRVVAVLGGVDLGSAASLPILTAAGIAYLGLTPLLPADFTTNGAFTLDPGGLGTAALASFAVDALGADRVAVLHHDSAQGRQLAEVFVRPALLQRGITPGRVELVAEKADAADLTPALAAATGGGADAVIVVFPPPACSRIMQGVAALGVKARMLYIGRCGGPNAVKAGGAGAEGAYFFSSILNPDAHPNDPDVRRYATKIAKFGDPGVDAGSYDTTRGFATTVTFFRRLARLKPTDLTASAVSTAFRSAVDAPAFMGHPYTCDGRQGIAGFVSLCNSHVRVYQVVGGRYRDASGDWIAAAAALPE